MEIGHTERLLQNIEIQTMANQAPLYVEQINTSLLSVGTLFKDLEKASSALSAADVDEAKALLNHVRNLKCELASLESLLSSRIHEEE
jgi:hypothetical protein